MTRRLIGTAFVVMACLYALPAHAQDAQPVDPPAHISFVEGSAVLERDGRVDSELASMPLLAGDRIRTHGGRVEVLFADGSALHLDANTVLDFQSDEVVRLLEGRIRLSIAGPARDLSYRVDAPSAWVRITDPGEYRIALIQDGDVELAVLRGAAELVNEQGRSYIRAGERTFARAGAAPSPPYVFNSAAWDAFDEWSEARRSARLGESAQYLPEDVRPYAGTFDKYGYWRHHAEYGYVWYPRVHVGWRPYHHGRWVSLRPWGWTWVAYDPWGWPTHHFGRWGFSAGVWFWIPGRHWGPAWVAWAYAPDYISWCPLGWNNRPIFSFVSVNIFGGHRYSRWHGWTVVPRHHFHRPHFSVRSAAIVRIDQRIVNKFVVRDHAPEARFAVSRSGSPIRTAGRRAVPRSVAASRNSLDAGRTLDAADRVTGRRLPAPARAPGTPTGSRAVARERSAGAIDSTPAARASSSLRAREAGTRSSAGAAYATPRSTAGVVSSPDSRDTSAVRSRTRSREAGVPVTPAPTGAVPRARRTGTTGSESARPGDRTFSAPAYAAPRSTAAPAPEYRRTPDADRRERSAEPAAPVTTPPAAVRAVPRARERSSGSSASTSPRVREERAPAFTPAPAPRSTAEVDVYRRAPSRSAPPAVREDGSRESRRTPSPARELRGRSAPRSAAPMPSPRSTAPAFRSAPSRPSAPSGPPPSAAPARRSGGGERSAGSSAGRHRSGGNESSAGRARRR